MTSISRFLPQKLVQFKEQHRLHKLILPVRLWWCSAYSVKEQLYFASLAVFSGCFGQSLAKVLKEIQSKKRNSRILQRK